MIGSVDLLTREDRLDVAYRCCGDHKIVEAPANVLLARLTLVAVEGELLRHQTSAKMHESTGTTRIEHRNGTHLRGGVELAPGVDEAAAEDGSERVPLLLREARRLLVGLGVREIDFLVGHVEVAAPEHRLALRLHLLQVREHCLVPLGCPVLQAVELRRNEHET